jgi:hypothetical protein
MEGKKIYLKYIYAGVVSALLTSSCGTVNILTRLERTPRAYTMNYCCSDARAPKNELIRETWVVFSDRDNNDTWQNPGGKVKFKQMSFMEAFFVTKTKGDYLRLIKYDPEITGNNPYARIMTNRKKAQYYGWVHKSRMLLTKQSTLDVATGFKNKAVTVISDTFAISSPHLVFDTDSALSYKDDDLTVFNSKIPVHELLYLYKYSLDRKKVLVGKKTTLNPMEASSEVPGWVSTSIIKEIGQRLFVDIKSVEKDMLSDEPVFQNKNCDDTLNINPVTSREIGRYSNRNPAFKYSPVRMYHRDSLFVSFNTSIMAPLIDKRFNYVLNLNGNKIMYENFLELEQDMKKLNVVFVFEGRERVFQEYPAILNIVQNMQMHFNAENDTYKYKFGAIIAYQDTVKRSFPRIKSYGMTDSHTGLMDFLLLEADSVTSYLPVNNNQAWYGLQKAVELIEPYNDETNLLIVIGQSSDGGYNEMADSILVKRIANANARILGYQIYSETNTAGNNFVLQLENMIDKYVEYETIAKRERLVYSSQYKPDYRYRESGRNIYTLDQEKSITQGWLLFPGKHESVQPDFIAKAIDTMIVEIKHDNDTIINCLYRAFDEFGVNRYRYDALWLDYNEMDSLYPLNQELTRRMPGNFPAWYLPSVPVTVTETDENLDYYLLLSEKEIREILFFLDDITQYEPDYKYKGKRSARKKLCNCPDDQLPEQPQGTPLYDKDGRRLYLNTYNIRRHVYKTLMDRLKHSNKLCRIRSCILKKYSLAEAELEIVGHPSTEKLVNKYIVKDIKRRKKIQDYELDELIVYFKGKRDTLKDYLLTDKNIAFASNSEPFYWIKRDMLP